MNLHDLSRILVIVAISDPLWSDSDVDQSWPVCPDRPVWIRGIVDLLDALKVYSRWLVGNTLILDSALIARCQPPYYESNMRIAAKVYGLPRGLQGIKDNLEPVADCKADHRGLWTIAGE